MSVCLKYAKNGCFHFIVAKLIVQLLNYMCSIIVAGIYFQKLAYSVLCDGLFGSAWNMALYTTWRYQNYRVDGLCADAVFVGGISAYGGRNNQFIGLERA